MDRALHTVALSLIDGLGIGEVVFEHGPHPASASVQEHPLVCLAEIERGADIGRWPSMDVPQRDYYLLGSRQVLERPSHDGHRLPIERSAFGPHGPWLRRGRPVVRPLWMTRR